MKKAIILKILFLLYMVLFTSCIEPVEPEFDLIFGLITVEGIVSNEQGASFVKIQESELDPVFDKKYTNIFLNDAEVTFINTNMSESINLVEDVEANIYLPPSDFAASIGDTWELDIKLPDGRHYKSLPEKIKEPVTIKEIEAIYKPELEYHTGRNDYVPGHIITVSFDDPENEKNYYYYNFRSFEKRRYCELCLGWYRDGNCRLFPPPPEEREPDPSYYTYACEVDCWQIRFNQNINLLEDTFINGNAVNFPAINILLYTKQDILVEVQQSSMSQLAYKYYKTIKDVIDNNGGFNAPPPAALVGNIFNVNDREEYVLGRFTASATSTASIFIERKYIEEPPIEGIALIAEGSVVNPYPPIPGEPVLYAPCVEGRYSTSVKPENWLD